MNSHAHNAHHTLNFSDSYIYIYMCNSFKRLMLTLVLQQNIHNQIPYWVFDTIWTARSLNKACYFRSVVTPTTTLLTSFPLSSTDIGFSTTTVWVWEWGVDVEVYGIIPVVPLGLLAGSGTLKLAILRLVTYWQIAHLTDGAPYGYMSVVRQFPQLIWATWLDTGAGFVVWQQEHLTLVAPCGYISNARQPKHIRCDISIPRGGGTKLIVLHNAQQTFAAPLG